ncbi:hypothetical protein [Clostridium sp. MSTE9]|uniref:hypothetical protein n=1 Tax=Clostridium sp. (strain MSTE9) TaxID=1105031 RepID=UPI000558DBA5|nr:hypothetical protein [Clostridium sp. MSTE9]
MRIDHGDAIELESIVRKVFSCDRAGMGGYIDADHFESAPFDAALIALAPLWERADFHEIEDFLFKWEESLRSGNGRNINIVSYINELENLVTTLMQR